MTEELQQTRVVKPLLTIAIPTYNRNYCLVVLLKSLAPQLRDEPRVELVISDNCSPDRTPALVEEFIGAGLRCRYIRNQENIGPDGNFLQCFEEASGKYVWIIGDDDVVIPGGLAVVLDLLARDEYDIVHLRGKVMVEGVIPDALSRTPRIEIIHDAQTFALRTHVSLTFITANILNRDRIASLPHRPFSELLGTHFIQLSWTYTAARYFRKGALILDPLMAARANELGGYGLFTVFGTNLKRITESWLVEPALVRIVMNGTLQRFLPVFVLRSKLQVGGFTDERPDALLASLFGNNYRYYLFLYPLLKLPGQLGRLWLLMGRIVNRMDRALGNPMLR